MLLSHLPACCCKGEVPEEHPAAPAPSVSNLTSNKKNKTEHYSNISVSKNITFKAEYSKEVLASEPQKIIFRSTGTAYYLD